MEKTNAEINIAIAMACGWTVENYGPEGRETLYWRLCHPNGTVRCDKCTGEKWSRLIFANMVPDYCNDLNAMHEAERTLTHAESKAYTSKLQNFVENTAGWPDFAVSVSAIVRATYFLEVINDQTRSSVSLGLGA